jgi:hypothetical protein
MTYGPPGEKSKNTYTLVMRLLAAPGAGVAETTVQDRIPVPRRSRLLSAKAIASSITSDPQYQIHSGVAADTTGRLLSALVEMTAANTVYSGTVDGTVDELAEDTILTLRLVTDGGDDLAGLVVTLELQALDIT